MGYNPDIHHRRSIRLKGYDYSREGLYFITICAQNRECLFGEIKDGKTYLNLAGKMIEEIYKELIIKEINLVKHAYVVMPNHFHCILEITNVGVESISTQKSNLDFLRADMESAPTEKINITLFIQSFKRCTTIEYIKMVKKGILKSFDKRIWQRNYYENIIRTEEAYLKVSRYIRENPLRWVEDKYYNGLYKNKRPNH